MNHRPFASKREGGTTRWVPGFRGEIWVGTPISQYTRSKIGTCSPHFISKQMTARALMDGMSSAAPQVSSRGSVKSDKPHVAELKILLKRAKGFSSTRYDRLSQGFSSAGLGKIADIKAPMALPPRSQPADLQPYLQLFSPHIYLNMFTSCRSKKLRVEVSNGEASMMRMVQVGAWCGLSLLRPMPEKTKEAT